jgi:hypothetical protein
MAKDPDWIAEFWGDGFLAAMKETGLDFPETCPWDVEAEVLKDDWPPTLEPPA